MAHIGCHLSAAAGYEKLGKTAVSIGADSFQFFTRNPRGGAARAIDDTDASKLAAILQENNFAPTMAHAPYTLNMASANPKTREFARMVISDDLARMERLPCSLYNFHPGSHTGVGTEEGTRNICGLLNEAITDETTTTILLETMSGKGSEIGRSFEELRDIIDRTERADKLGVCMDICHVFSAGYDVVNRLDEVIEEFDRVIGLSRLKIIHLNDSAMPFGSNKDRHAPIGEGQIGLDAVLRLMSHPALKKLPFILETPLDEDGHRREIAMLREMLAATER